MSIHGTHVQMHFVVRPQESPLLPGNTTATTVTSEVGDFVQTIDHEAARRFPCPPTMTDDHKKSKSQIEMKVSSGKSDVASVIDCPATFGGCHGVAVKLLRSLCSALFLMIGSTLQLCWIEREWLIRQIPVLKHVPIYSWSSNAIQLLDPLFGMISVLIIGSLIYPDMKQSGLILLQTMPASLDLGNLRRQLLKQCPSVLGIHELHIWCLTSSTTIATCHLLLLEQFSSRVEYDHFIQQVDAVFRRQGISRVTVQPEFLRPNSSTSSSSLPSSSSTNPSLPSQSSTDCLFPCPANTGDCAQKLCCHRKDEDGQCSQINV